MLEFTPASLQLGDIAVNDIPVYQRLRLRNRETVPVVVQLSSSSALLHFQLYNENLHILETGGAAELSASYDRAFDLVGLITAITLAGGAEAEVIVSFYADPGSFPHLLAQTPPLPVHEVIHFTATTTSNSNGNVPNAPPSLSRRTSESPLQETASPTTGASPTGSASHLRRITSCVDGMNNPVTPTTTAVAGGSSAVAMPHAGASLVSSPTLNPSASGTTPALGAVRAETLSLAVTARVFLSSLQLSTSELRATMSANRTQILDFTVTNVSCSALTFIVRDQSMRVAGLEVALFIAERFEEPQLGRRIALESGASVSLSLIVRTAGPELLQVPQEVPIVLQCDNLRDARNTALLLVSLSLVSELEGDLVSVDDTSVDFHEVYRGASTRAELAVVSHELREDVVLRLGHVSRRAAEGGVTLCRLLPAHSLTTVTTAAGTMQAGNQPHAQIPTTSATNTITSNTTSSGNGVLTGPDGTEMACVAVDELVLPAQSSAHFRAAATTTSSMSNIMRLQSMNELGYVSGPPQSAQSSAASRQLRFALLYSPALPSSSSSSTSNTTTTTTTTAAAVTTQNTANTTSSSSTAGALGANAELTTGAVESGGAGVSVSPRNASLGLGRGADVTETTGPTGTSNNNNTTTNTGNVLSSGTSSTGDQMMSAVARHGTNNAVSEKTRVRFDVELMAATTSGSRQQRLLLRCQATLHTSTILVHPLVLNFGDCAVGQSKRLSFSIENQAALPGRVLVQIRSKIISIEGAATHVGSRETTGLAQGTRQAALLGALPTPMTSNGRELCESFTIAPLSTLPITLRIAPQRVNPLYRKQLTVVNAATRQEDRVIVTIESNNMAPPEAKRHNELYTWDYLPWTGTPTLLPSQNATNTITSTSNNNNVSASSSMNAAGNAGLEVNSSGSHHDDSGSFVATTQGSSSNNNNTANTATTTTTNNNTSPPPPPITNTNSVPAAVPPVFYAITNLPLVIPYVVQSKTDHPLHLHVESTSSEVEVFVLNTPERASQLDALAAEMRAYALYEDVEDVQGDWLRSHASRVEFARRELLAFLAEHALFVSDLSLAPRASLRVYAIIIRSSPTTEALSKEDGLSIFVDSIEAPRFIRLSYKVCSSAFELNGQKTKNFGEVNIGTRRSTKIQVVNRCQAVLFLRLSKSRSVTAGHLRVEHSDRQVLTLALRPYATKEIEVTFYPGIKGTFDESIRLMNVLDPRNHTTVTLKATVIKADTFEVSPDAWSFGPVTIPAPITTPMVTSNVNSSSSTGEKEVTSGAQIASVNAMRKASVRVGARFMVCNTSQTRRQIHLRLDPSALLASLTTTATPTHNSDELSTTAHFAEEAAAYLRAEAETEEGDALRRILSRAMDALHLPGAELQIEIEMQLCGSSSGSTRKIAEEIERLEQKLKIYKRKKKAVKAESALRRIAVLKRALQGEGVDLDATAPNEGSTQAAQETSATKEEEEKEKSSSKAKGDDENKNKSNVGKDNGTNANAELHPSTAAPAAAQQAASAETPPQHDEQPQAQTNNNSSSGRSPSAHAAAVGGVGETKERVDLIRRRVTAAELLSLLLRDGVALPLMAAGESVSILLELRCTRVPHEPLPQAQTITFNLFLAEAKDQEINRIVPVDITLLRHPDDTLDELTLADTNTNANSSAVVVGGTGLAHPLQDRPLLTRTAGNKALVAAQSLNAGRQSLLRVSWPRGGAVQSMGTATFMGYPLLALSNCIVNDRVEFVLHVRASAPTTCVVLEPRRCTNHHHMVRNQGMMLDAQFKFYPRNGPVGGSTSKNNNTSSTSGTSAISHSRTQRPNTTSSDATGHNENNNIDDDDERESALQITVDCTPRSVGPQKYFLPLKNLHNPADIAYVVVEMNPSLEEELITTEPKLLQFNPVITPCLITPSEHVNGTSNSSEEHHEAQLLFIRSRFPSSHVLLVRSTLPSQIRFFEDAQCRVPLQQPLRRSYIRESIRVYVQFRPSPRSCESKARTIHAGILIEALATTTTTTTTTSSNNISSSVSAQVQHYGSRSNNSSGNATPNAVPALPMSNTVATTKQAMSFTIVGRAVVPCTVCVGSGVLNVLQSRLELGTIAASERLVRTSITIENPSDMFYIRASLVAPASRISFDAAPDTATGLLTTTSGVENSASSPSEAYRDAMFFPTTANTTTASRVGSPGFRTPTTATHPSLTPTISTEEGSNERMTQLELTLRPRETRHVPLTFHLPSPGYVETSVRLYNRSCKQAPQRITLSALRPDETVIVYLNGTAMGSRSSNMMIESSPRGTNNAVATSSISKSEEEHKTLASEFTAMTLELPMAAVVRCDSENTNNNTTSEEGNENGVHLQLYSILHAASSSAAYYNNNSRSSSTAVGGDRGVAFDSHVPVRIVNRGAQDLVLMSQCELLPLDFMLDDNNTTTTTSHRGGADTTHVSPSSLRDTENIMNVEDNDSAGVSEGYRRQGLRRGQATTCYTTPTTTNATNTNRFEGDTNETRNRTAGVYYTPPQQRRRRVGQSGDTSNESDEAVRHSSSASATHSRHERRAESAHNNNEEASHEVQQQQQSENRVLVKAHSAVYVRWRLASPPAALRHYADLLLQEHGMVTITATIQLNIVAVTEKAGLTLFARRRAAVGSTTTSNNVVAVPSAPLVGQCVALIPVRVSFAMSEGAAQPGLIELGVVGLGRQGNAHMHSHNTHHARSEIASHDMTLNSNTNERRGRLMNTSPPGHHPMIEMRLVNLSLYLPLRLRTECPPTIRLAAPRFLSIAPGQTLVVHGHIQLTQLPTQGPFRLDACFVNELNPENDITVRITGQYLSKVFQLLSQIGEEVKGAMDLTAMQVDCGGTVPLMLAERKLVLVALGHDVDVEVQIRMNPRLENLLELQLLSHDAMTRADTLHLAAPAASTPSVTTNMSSTYTSQPTTTQSIAASLLSAPQVTSSTTLPSTSTLPALSLSTTTNNTSSTSKVAAGSTPASGTPLSSLAASMNTTTTGNNSGNGDAFFGSHNDPLHAMGTRHSTNTTTTNASSTSRRKAMSGGLAQTGQKLRLRCVLRKANLAALAAVFYGSGRRKPKSVALMAPSNTKSREAENETATNSGTRAKVSATTSQWTAGGEEMPTFDQLPEFERMRQPTNNSSSSHSVWLGTLILSNRITAEEEIEIYGQLQRFQTFTAPAKATLRPFHLPGCHFFSSNAIASCAIEQCSSTDAVSIEESTWASAGQTAVRSTQATQPARSTLLYAGELTLRNACVANGTSVQLAVVMSERLPVALIVELISQSSVVESAQEDNNEEDNGKGAEQQKEEGQTMTHKTNTNDVSNESARHSRVHSPIPPPSPSARSVNEDTGLVSTTFTNASNNNERISSSEGTKGQASKVNTTQPVHTLRLGPGGSGTVYVLIRAVDAAAQDALQHVFLEQYVAIAMRDANISFAVGVTRFSVTVGGGSVGGNGGAESERNAMGVAANVTNAVDEAHTSTGSSREGEALLTTTTTSSTVSSSVTSREALHQALGLSELRGGGEEYLWLEKLLRARLSRIHSAPGTTASTSSSVVSHRSTSSVPDMMSHTLPPATSLSEVQKGSTTVLVNSAVTTAHTSQNSSLVTGVEGHPLQDTSLLPSTANTILTPQATMTSSAHATLTETATQRQGATKETTQQDRSGLATVSAPGSTTPSPDTRSIEGGKEVNASSAPIRPETPHNNTNTVATSTMSVAESSGAITPERVTQSNTPVLTLRRCQPVPETIGVYAASYTFAKDDPPDPEIVICNNLTDRAVEYSVSITSQSPLPWLLLPSATGHLEANGTQPLRLNLLAGEVGFFVGYIALYNTIRSDEVTYLRLSAEIFIPGSGDGLFEVVTCNGVRVASNSTRNVALGHLYGAGSMRACVALELVNRGNVPLEFPVSVVRPFRLTLRPLPEDLLMRHDLHKDVSTSSGRLQRALMQGVKAAEKSRSTTVSHSHRTEKGEDEREVTTHDEAPEEQKGSAVVTQQATITTITTASEGHDENRTTTSVGHEPHRTTSSHASSTIARSPPHTTTITTNNVPAPVFEGQLAVCHIHGVATMSGQRYIVVDPRSRVRLAFVLACESLQVAEGYGVSGTADVVFRCKQARDAVFTFRTTFDAFSPSFAVEREYVVTPFTDPTTTTTNNTMSGGLARVTVTNLLHVPQAFVFRTQSPILSVMAQNTATSHNDTSIQREEEDKPVTNANTQNAQALVLSSSSPENTLRDSTQRLCEGNVSRLQVALTTGPRHSVAQLAIPPHGSLSFFVYLDLLKAATLTNQPRSAVCALGVREHGVLLNLLNPRERVHVEVVHIAATVASNTSEGNSLLPLLTHSPGKSHTTITSAGHREAMSMASHAQARPLWRDAGPYNNTNTNSGDGNEDVYRTTSGACVEGGTMTSLSGALIPAPYYANLPVTVIRPVKSGTGQYFSERYILCFAQRFSRTLTRYAVRLLTAFRTHAAARGETVTLPSFALGLNEAEREAFRVGTNNNNIPTTASARMNYHNDASSTTTTTSSSSRSTYSSASDSRRSNTPHVNITEHPTGNRSAVTTHTSTTTAGNTEEEYERHSRVRRRGRRMTERSADERAEEHNATLNNGLPSRAWAKLHRLLVELTWLVDELLFYTILLRNSRLIDGYCVFLVAAVTNHVVMRTWWSARQLLTAVPEYRIFAQYMEVLDELPCPTPSLSGN